jgi:hypothetical protein
MYINYTFVIELEEPCEGRLSSTVPWERKGETPLRDPTNKVPYKPITDYEFLDQKRKRKVKEMRKLIAKFDIKNDELGFAMA